MGARTDAARAEVLAAREGLDEELVRLEASGRAAVDIPARLKREPGSGLATGGVTLPMALAELDLIDEYEFVVHPRLAGHGPTLFAGLSKRIDLTLVSREELGSGVVSMRYLPKK